MQILELSNENPLIQDVHNNRGTEDTKMVHELASGISEIANMQ